MLARTHGNLVLRVLCRCSSLAVAVHAPIGLRNVMREWTPWRGRSLDMALAMFAVLLLVLGFRAVVAVYLPPDCSDDARLAHAAGLSRRRCCTACPASRSRSSCRCISSRSPTALDGADCARQLPRGHRHAARQGERMRLVVALAIHMTLGLRILAIELLGVRERTVAVLTGCAAAVFAVGAGVPAQRRVTPGLTPAPPWRRMSRHPTSSPRSRDWQPPCRSAAAARSRSSRASTAAAAWR